MVRLHCTVPSDLFPFLSRLTSFIQLLSSVASSTQYSGARCMAWRHTAQQFFLHPRTGCPSGYVLPVCYYFTWLTGTPLDPSSAHPVFTTSFFQFNPHFLPSHKHYYVSSAVPPKQLTSLQQLGCPILFFFFQKLWISSYLLYPQNAFQLYPTFLCIYHSPCKQFPISCPSWTMSVNLRDFLFLSDNYHSILGILR